MRVRDQAPDPAPARPAAPPGRRRAAVAGERSLTEHITDPRNTVLFLLVLAVLVGGGRRLLQAWRGRRAVARLAATDVTPAEVEAIASHGRAGLMDLFRLLDTGPTPEVRQAAGRALATLWAQDQLIAEEEQAIVRRGFTVSWRARRRYPRGLRAPFPITASYEVPFLRDGGDGIAASHLEWSHRITGADRASLEQFQPWQAGPGRASFALDPADFPSTGPHRLVLQARARPTGMASSWELDLPHVPFSFEFDPNLAVDALLTLPDDTRAETFARSVRLETEPGDQPRFLDLNAEFALRDPPSLIVTTPLPCDLAHTLAIEVEDVPGRFAAGTLVLSGQGNDPHEPIARRAFPLAPPVGLTSDAIDRPGDRRLRVVLTADPDLGWADPDVRSVWPGTIVTDWLTVRVIRR